jgi:hypothetical protein
MPPYYSNEINVSVGYPLNEVTISASHSNEDLANNICMKDEV